MSTLVSLRKSVYWISLAVLAVAWGLTAPAHAQPALPTGFIDETVVSGLDQPNGMAFLPDGRILITEQYTGKIRLIVNGHVASTDPAVTVSPVRTASMAPYLVRIIA